MNGTTDKQFWILELFLLGLLLLVNSCVAFTVRTPLAYCLPPLTLLYAGIVVYRGIKRFYGGRRKP